MFDDLLSHWPFIAAAAVFAICGQIAKGTTFSIDALKRTTGWQHNALWWGRKTLPLHPVVAGIVLGFVPGMPVSPGVPASHAAAALYFAGAGVASTWVFAILKGVMKQRGIELDDKES